MNLEFTFLFLLVIVLIQCNGSPLPSKSDYRKHIMRKVFLVRPTDPLDNELNEGPVITTFLDHFNSGIDAYLQNDYDGCVHHFEGAIQGYHEYYDTVTRCRQQCEVERVSHRPRFPENPEHLHFFEGTIVKTICLRKCMSKNLVNVPKYFMIDDWHRTQFESRAPYEYLQLCYYRQKEIEKAIQATYTVLVVRPDDHLSLLNMKFYMTQPEFNKDQLRDLEEKRYVAPYVDGIQAYDKENWSVAINLLEKSLELFIEEDNDCRAFCEDAFDQGWFPDFVSSTASKSRCFNYRNLINNYVPEF